MEVTRVRALRGPNLWTRHTVLELQLTLDDDEHAFDAIPGCESRLLSRFPRMGPLRFRGDPNPVSSAHVLETAALHLQAAAGCPVAFGHTSRIGRDGPYCVVVEYAEEKIGRLAVTLAEQLFAAARADTPFDVDTALLTLRDLYEDIRMGPSTGAIAQAAKARGIPFLRLTRGSLVQLGWGSRQRRIQAAETDTTGAIAEAIAQDKDLTKQLLMAAGLPVPDGASVRSLDAAWDTMTRLGSAVVVKPRDGNQGRGVTTNVTDRQQMATAFRAAQAHDADVIVERFIPGDDYRLLVVGDRLVAAARREAPNVIGDGVRTISELVAFVNTDPRRGIGHATPLTRIRLDEIAIDCLRSQGCGPETVPPRGERVLLRNNANLSTGGAATDVTDIVHPEVTRRAVEAARMVGLDICGVDIVCESVLKPLEDQGGAIVEVNAVPGLRMHLDPSYGQGRDIGGAIVRHMFGTHGDARIPIVAVTGTNGKTTTVRLVTRMLASTGLTVGMTNTDGIFVNDVRIDTGDCSGPRSARKLLGHPEVDAAVLETARGGILREGLGFDRCKVGVVTNVGRGDHLGLDHIDTADAIALVKQVVVQNVAANGTAVLNAADPRVAAMAGACPGSVLFFSRNASVPVMVEHRARGKRTVSVADGDIVAAEGRKEVRRIPLAAVPLTRGGALHFQVENVLAAVGAAWALGLHWTAIESALAAFECDAVTAPGRFNEFRHRGASIIADYGHNPDALIALAQALDAWPGARRTLVISAAGDRRDEDIVDQARIVGTHFDEVILYQDAAQRGRADGEVIGLLRQGLAGATRVKSIDEIRGEFLAIDTALARLRHGDVCLILIDQVEEALAHIAKRVAEP